jgi:release factor glutamine methyltransferase
MNEPLASRPPVQVAGLLAEGRRRLTAASFAIVPREAVLLLSHVLGTPETWILAHGEEAVDAAARQRFLTLVERRLEGEPIAYLLGAREFYGRSFAVDRRVLIPRPETEHLIAAALDLELPPAPRILDIGTGSGAIAVTLACELPQATVIASDRSLATLAVARENARRHGVGARVQPLAADLATGIDLAAIDLVVSNPPYVDRAEAALLSHEILAFEPHLALFSPETGWSTLARIIRQCQALRADTPLVLEIGAGQLEPVTQVLHQAEFGLLRIEPDYAGIPRVLVVRREKASGA